jgi:hypothetical protein
VLFLSLPDAGNAIRNPGQDVVLKRVRVTDRERLPYASRTNPYAPLDRSALACPFARDTDRTLIPTRSGVRNEADAIVNGPRLVGSG